MRYEWEEELIYGNTVPSSPQIQWCLKKVIPAKDPTATAPFSIVSGPYKQICALVRLVSERRYRVHFQSVVHMDNDKTFRSLKAAKAYAVAIITLEQ